MTTPDNTVRDVVNNSGGLVAHWTYDSFGDVQEFNASGTNVTATTGCTLNCTFAYAFDGRVGRSGEALPDETVPMIRRVVGV